MRVAERRAGYAGSMSTEQPETDVDAAEVLEEPEAQPDTVRPTDDSEDVAAKIAQEEAGRAPQGE